MWKFILGLKLGALLMLLLLNGGGASDTLNILLNEAAPTLSRLQESLPMTSAVWEPIESDALMATSTDQSWNTFSGE
ncbi:hypothetical protein [Magnetococcus marinus]|uniref:hypothetical protein n=1 Tax=Magnetococcus marinus TaxID=1124597 RepID=UPI00003C54BC|nr:hypothetical protein [Magnetococcus marinus]